MLQRMSKEGYPSRVAIDDDDDGLQVELCHAMQVSSKCVRPENRCLSNSQTYRQTSYNRPRDAISKPLEHIPRYAGGLSDQPTNYWFVLHLFD